LLWGNGVLKVLHAMLLAFRLAWALDGVRNGEWGKRWEGKGVSFLKLAVTGSKFPISCLASSVLRAPRPRENRSVQADPFSLHGPTKIAQFRTRFPRFPIRPPELRLTVASIHNVNMNR